NALRGIPGVTPAREPGMPRRAFPTGRLLPARGMREMTEHQIDLKALLVEKPDCDAGTVQQLRNALAQGGTQYRTLRDVTEALKKKLENAPPAQAKVWNLKIGIASYFLGYTKQAIDHLRHADTALARFYLGRALVSR